MTPLEQFLKEQNACMLNSLQESYAKLGRTEGILSYIYQQYPRLCMIVVKGEKYDEQRTTVRKNKYMRIAR